MKFEILRGKGGGPQWGARPPPDPLFANPAHNAQYNAPISVANEVAALSALIEGCEVALRGYPRARAPPPPNALPAIPAPPAPTSHVPPATWQTEAEDAALMENSKMFAALPRLARMSVKLVRNEKRILLRSISVCETQIREMSPR